MTKTKPKHLALVEVVSLTVKSHSVNTPTTVTQWFRKLLHKEQWPESTRGNREPSPVRTAGQKQAGAGGPWNPQGGSPGRTFRQASAYATGRAVGRSRTYEFRLPAVHGLLRSAGRRRALPADPLVLPPAATRWRARPRPPRLHGRALKRRNGDSRGLRLERLSWAGPAGRRGGVGGGLRDKARQRIYSQQPLIQVAMAALRTAPRKQLRATHGPGAAQRTPNGRTPTLSAQECNAVRIVPPLPVPPHTPPRQPIHGGRRKRSLPDWMAFCQSPLNQLFSPRAGALAARFSHYVSQRALWPAPRARREL